ncbi:hypothetical protein J832_1030 [Acinetobacter baumannii 25691_9]|nr:hypothetical protein J860_1593 [Acinetobacter baumannii 25561_7]EXV85309.1 hypothetical protein J832_1030 [Acinetobacter baumannii 25691_9]EXV98940.1 hypothetical protein J823_1145 [Acinetobacter baumannii 25766_10]EXX01743.1 hypothetical protein J888_0737 [Acinetobacter baumannii 44327_5]EXX41896.1 hypothetical protein J909_1449 [Acinetobacter baumannii 25681_6]EYD36522.1 hypothetical protein J945_2967 [Acinetobacter baumannii 25878_2]EYT18600.1 hypothetical protein J595_01570 [Acinetobac
MQIGDALAAGMPPVEQPYKEVRFAQQKVFWLLLTFQK